MKTIYSDILKAYQQGQKLVAVLIDPDNVKLNEVSQLVQSIENTIVTHILVGGSLLSTNELELLIREIKLHTLLPIILFPGNNSQVTDEVDALLFLSLVSGRNPEYLIGQQVQAAPIIKRLGIETIATGYVLIESGVATSVSYISNTTPIPRDKTDIAVATCLASEMLGMQSIYLEGGSGAKLAVPYETVKAVTDSLAIPVIVGGGIRSGSVIKKMHDSGATMVVIGTAFEENPSFFVK